jgi:hypothetical protein
MRKKDYELIGYWIKATEIDRLQKWEIVRTLANAFYMHDQKFDTRKFVKSCGY